MNDSSRPPATRSFEESRRLFERAVRCIPGGIYGHVAPALIAPGAAPYYARRAWGCRYEDVDGNEYLDFMCSYGAMLLGHNHPEIEAAVERQRREGDCLDHPAPVMVDLAERLVALIDFADWVVFGKNGSDMTTWAMRVAREHTGRRKIFMVEGAYHGIDAWCTPAPGGVLQEDRIHVHTFRWNDPDGFDVLCRRHGADAAAVIVTPFHHPMFEDSRLPQEGFFRHLETRCREQGIVLVLDDVRAGFRLHRGGSHRHFGFEPDLACYGKALGNGHAISATAGRAALRQAAGRVYLTGSGWHGAVAMAAALATIDLVTRPGTLEALQSAGRAWCDGLRERAARHGLQVAISGPPAMPFMRFANETNFFRSQRFARACIEHGVFLHPHHNWFLSAAHGSADIACALDVADQAFAVVREQFGS